MQSSENGSSTTPPTFGSLHGVHWVVVALSVFITIAAWWFAKNQLDEKIETRFERYASQTVELISERMQKYEDALWGGVGVLRSHDAEFTHSRWLRFAQTLSIDVKYPGINGIGVIYQLEPAEVPAYLARERLTRPDFRIYPEHQEGEFLPITYIEPVQTNLAAVGLDMAHETNRYEAARKARDSGRAQITGPITLVQDAERTPGFLFYVPFYDSDLVATLDDRREHFSGMVYAPFVVTKLMRGVLARQNRYVGIRIQDGTDVLFDEHHAGEMDYDPDPLFEKRVDIALYGRTWTFDIRTARSFRSVAQSHQPLTILLGGLAIDALLFGIFVVLARSNKRAVRYAELTTHQLREKTEQLESQALDLKRSNEELNRFAAVASHDLQEPLRKILTFGGMLKGSLSDPDDRTQDYLNRMLNGASRMQTLIRDILSLSQVNIAGDQFSNVDLNSVVKHIVDEAHERISQTGATVEIDELPHIIADPSQMRQLFHNLLGNALKYRQPDREPRIRISARTLSSDPNRFRRASENQTWYEIRIDDNGVGFDPQYAEKIFHPFQRLHGRSDFEGNGIGLAICERVAVRHGGLITADSTPGVGSSFYIFLPSDPTAVTADTPAMNRSDTVTAT